MKMLWAKEYQMIMVECNTVHAEIFAVCIYYKIKSHYKELRWKELDMKMLWAKEYQMIMVECNTVHVEIFAVCIFHG